jgi:phage FluMu protein Com
LGKCPHCGVRDYPFYIEAQEIDFKVISASPMELEIKCPRCGEAIEHAEESITSSGW